jgi:hypothetical protein
LGGRGRFLLNRTDSWFAHFVLKCSRILQHRQIDCNYPTYHDFLDLSLRDIELEVPLDERPDGRDRFGWG